MGLLTVIIADDMTGALDSGVKLAQRGIRAVAAVDWGGDAAIPNGCEALIINTESRHLSPENAYERVFQAAKWAMEKGARLIYKKADSTLRGNIGAELQAVCDVLGSGVVFAPALPQSDRATVLGVHYVGGVPLAETSFAVDPLNPVGRSDVAGIITRQATLPVRLVKRGEVIDGGFSGVTICDASSDGDLRSIAEKMRLMGARCLAGSAGLAEFIPQILGIEERKRAPVGFKKPLLFAVGSVNRTAVGQTNFAADAGMAVQTLSGDEIIAGKACAQTVRRGVDCISRGDSFIIRCVSAQEDAAKLIACGKKMGISADEIAKRAGKTIAGAVADILRGAGGATLVVFGGDTLLSILRELSITDLMPVCELFPGVVLSFSGDMGIISKAGGFGGEDIIVRLAGEKE